MTIIWGFGGKTKNPDDLWLPYWCTHCRELKPYLVMENYRYGHVYGIRIAKYKAQYFLVCSSCQDMYAIESKEDFVTAQSIARRVGNTSPDLLNLFGIAEEVASRVLHNLEAARLFAGFRDSAVTSSEELQQEVSASVQQSTTMAVPNADEKLCPDCAETIKAAARKCRFCGFRMDEQQ